LRCRDGTTLRQDREEQAISVTKCDPRIQYKQSKVGSNVHIHVAVYSNANRANRLAFGATRKSEKKALFTPIPGPGAQLRHTLVLMIPSLPLPSAIWQYTLPPQLALSPALTVQLYSLLPM
jgi:hypothetical protein